VFADRAYQALLICVGEDGEGVQQMKCLMNDPASHADFGLISKMWKSAKNAVPKDMNEKDFEKWLWLLK
jgi:hypothetical protein